MRKFLQKIFKHHKSEIVTLREIKDQRKALGVGICITLFERFLMWVFK